MSGRHDVSNGNFWTSKKKSTSYDWQIITRQATPPAYLAGESRGAAAVSPAEGKASAARSSAAVARTCLAKGSPAAFGRGRSLEAVSAASAGVVGWRIARTG